MNSSIRSGSVRAGFLDPGLLVGGNVAKNRRVMCHRFGLDATLQYNGAFGSGFSANSDAFKLTWRF